ncbi:MAG: N-acetylmuramoyl-L-alanine amidase [Runella sp.]
MRTSAKYTFIIFLFWRIGYTQNQYTFSQTLGENSRGRIVLQQPATSLVFVFDHQPDWATCRIVVDEDTLTLYPDPHGEGIQSQLVILRKPTTAIEWIGTTSAASLTGIYVKPLTLPVFYRQFRLFSNCDKPLVVPVSVWRAGLTPPKEPPTATNVRFIIVHHEAGSNSPANFVNTVRNIYVFHTQTNGWNDIGYNFLIAQDGTVFEGRDGQGRMDNDNVQGAHFCGANAGTMGICLLGNYMTAQPTAPALASLKQLIAWKMKKENLIDPSSRMFHSSLGKNLTLVSGHRDGCATDCPGNNLYEIMDQIRNEVANSCDGLKPVITAISPLLVLPYVYPNPSTGVFTVESSRPLSQLSIVDALGRMVLSENFKTPIKRFEGRLPSAGIFTVVTTDEGGNTHTLPLWVKF